MKFRENYTSHRDCPYCGHYHKGRSRTAQEVADQEADDNVTICRNTRRLLGQPDYNPQTEKASV